MTDNLPSLYRFWNRNNNQVCAEPMKRAGGALGEAAMDQSRMISFIIPAHHEELWIGQCLTSIHTTLQSVREPFDRD